MSTPPPNLFSKKPEDPGINKLGSLFAIPSNPTGSTFNKTNLFGQSIAGPSIFSLTGNTPANSGNPGATTNQTIATASEPASSSTMFSLNSLQANPSSASGAGLFGGSGASNLFLSSNPKKQEEKTHPVVSLADSVKKEVNSVKKPQPSINIADSARSFERLKSNKQLQEERKKLEEERKIIKSELDKITAEQNSQQNKMKEIKKRYKSAFNEKQRLLDNEKESEERAANINKQEQICHNEKINETNLLPKLEEISNNKMIIVQRLTKIDEAIYSNKEGLKSRAVVDDYNTKFSTLQKYIAKKIEEYQLQVTKMWRKYSELSNTKHTDEIIKQLLIMDKDLEKIVLSKNGYIVDRKQIQNQIKLSGKYDKQFDFKQDLEELDRETYKDATEFVKKMMNQWEGQVPPELSVPKELTAQEKKQQEERIKKEKERQEELLRQRKLDQAKRLRLQAQLKIKNQAERTENQAKYNKLLPKINSLQKIVEQIEKKLASQSLIDVVDIAKRIEIIESKSSTLLSLRQNAQIFDNEVQKLEQLSKALNNQAQIFEITSKNTALKMLIESEATELYNAENLTRRIAREAQQQKLRQQLEREEEIRKRDSYVNSIEQTVLYENKLKELKSNLNEQKFRLLQIKQHLINQVKVLIELGKLSPEELKAHHFDYTEYQTLIYRKSQLIEELAAKQQKNESLILSDQFKNIEIKLKIMQEPINFEMVKASNHYPIDLLKKTKHFLFIEMKNKELNTMKQNREKIERDVAKLNQQKKKKQEVIELLKRQTEELNEMNKKEINSNWQGFTADINILVPNQLPVIEQGNILPPDIASRIDQSIIQPLGSTKIVNKAQITNLYNAFKDDKLIQQIQTLQTNLLSIRDKRQCQEGLFQQAQQSKKMSVNQRKSPQFKEEDAKIQKLTEEMVQLMKQCDLLQKQKKSRVKGVSQIRMISSIHQ